MIQLNSTNRNVLHKSADVRLYSDHRVLYMRSRKDTAPSNEKINKVSTLGAAAL